MLRPILLAAIVAVFITPAVAAEKEQRQHGAHEHGAAELNLVWEGKVVAIELESPAVNIVGFEHAPRTSAQKKAVQDALAVLNNADKVFGFTPQAQCRSQTTEVETELAKPQSGAKKTAAEEEHSEFHAQYRFTCEKPDALKAVEVHLFKLFPKTRALRAQIVSPKGQTATELKPGQTRLILQ